MASDKIDLKRMVASFHIPELQILLGLLKMNKYGRKAELVQRAQTALARGVSRQVQEEIKELYRRKFSVRQYMNDVEHITKPVIPSANMSAPRMYYPNGAYHGMIPHASTATAAAVPVAADCLMPVHPDVRLKMLPFYDLMAELLKPSTLLCRSSVGPQESFFNFHLTPLQSQDISMSRDVQVQLRFCLLETSCEQQDKFPSGIGVRINNKPAQLPPPIPTNKLGVEPKRPGLPVNITPQCHLSAAAPNHIHVTWTPEIGRTFCVAVYLVKQLNSDILLHRLKQNGVRHPYHTRALVKEKLAVDLDSEIATTSLRISLICPLGKVRMRLPCRASTCSHLQCFDAATFIQMNEKKPTWICPICDKAAEFNKLIIDGMFSEILTKESNCTEIQFTEDGNWKALGSDGDEYLIPDSPPPTKMQTKASEADTTVADSSKASMFPETIDLTETDEEEEEEAADVSKLSWPSFYEGDGLTANQPPSYVSHPPSVISLNDSCDMLQPLYSTLSRDSSCSSVITIDTPPPPAHSPYMTPRAAHSSLSAGSVDGTSPSRPPPAHSNNSSSRGSHERPWIVCRAPVETTISPLSLTLRRAPEASSCCSNITSSPSTYDSS